MVQRFKEVRFASFLSATGQILVSFFLPLFQQMLQREIFTKKYSNQLTLKDFRKHWDFGPTSSTPPPQRGSGHCQLKTLMFILRFRPFLAQSYIFSFHFSFCHKIDVFFYQSQCQLFYAEKPWYDPLVTYLAFSKAKNLYCTEDDRAVKNSRRGARTALIFQEAGDCSHFQLSSLLGHPSNFTSFSR